MVPAIPSSDMHDLVLRLLVTVVASIDMKTRAIEMGKAGGKVQALGSGRGYEAVEFGHPRDRERIQGPAEGVIVELGGGDAGRNASRGGFILKESGDQGKRLVDKPQAIEHHRFDRLPYCEITHCWILVGGLIEDVANAEFIEHASNKAEVV